ncbi:Gx transporter family protein [Sporomusa acidovorans]|uniref:Heptaprenyl diphosphate synthase component I n=1 Tax=Sporomusa acidovorans (strain ATCC 49682 / DSM 3132 / Mol) TaxID=1123286 RepID=A0ABZ3J1G3_SPOA4|nr:Gx transporter family protein [Sporomusa acidovorans]OZC22502.1 heptaprenyl diphosphate synthase component I [Sporomusa acidovorans DSM 3132]SDE73458.1 heptaprenyl diphosphate synthase [Sporomusa acidovorans]
MGKTKRLVVLALLVAMAATLHVVESQLPLPVPIPGAKLGLANAISLLAIVMLGWRDAVYVAVARILLGSLFGGSLLGPAFIMSMGGAFASIFSMVYICNHYLGLFSLAGVSLFGAAIHNITQVVLAAILVHSAGLLWYAPYLLIFAIPTGLFTGLAANYCLAKVPEKYGLKFRNIE